jgi:large subunit ribosomal protein L7e
MICLCYRTVPTKEDILVPETLLKKRKSQEKERAAKAEELSKKRKVSFKSSTFLFRGHVDENFNYAD